MFSNNIFWSCFSPLLVPPRSSPPPCPLNFMFFSISKKKRNQNKRQETQPSPPPPPHKHIKTNKEKTKKTKQNETKHFMSANYPWAWVLPWCVADKPNKTSLEKTDFLSACRYHLQISSWMGVRAHAHFPLSVLRPHPVWSCAGLAHVLTISGCAYVHLPLVSGKRCFFEDIHHLWLLNFPAFYSSWILERRDLMKILCLVLSVSKSLPLYTLLY